MITGIIQASGFSRRMKRDKLLMKIEGIPMVERVIQSGKESLLDEIILIYRTEEVKKIGERYKIKTFYNPNAYLGQSEGVKLGVEKSQNSEAYMFLMGDQPFITFSLINKLIEEYKKTGAEIVVPYYNGKRGMPAIFSSKFKEDFLKIEGDKGGRDILEKNISLVRKVHIKDERLGRDIDKLEDL